MYDNEFIEFRHISNGVVKMYPRHYADHPVFGPDLEIYNPDEYEEDKVVVENHELPVEQRGTIISIPVEDVETEEADFLDGLDEETDDEEKE